MVVKKVNVIGLGRIGLPTAACLADAGLGVRGVDIDQDRLESIAEGRLDRLEPGLIQVVQKGISSGLLELSDRPAEGDAFILCLPTPLSEGGDCDLSFLESALGPLAQVLRKRNLVVLESTVPVHTTRDFVVPKLADLGADTTEVLFAYAPERITSGRMLEELRKGDRVIGGLTPEAAEAARELYACFVQGEVILTDSSTAELVKLMENIYRDVNIAFANEVALFCDREGIDAWEAIRLANRHPRVNVHRPGPGVGGHCIPVVPHFLAKATSHDIVIRAAREVNDSMPRYVANLVSRAVSGIPSPRVAIMGVAFKPNSSDPINSPAMHVAQLLGAQGLSVMMCDPLVEDPETETVGLEEATGADCLVFLMAHDIFRELVPTNPRKGRGIVVDIANCINLDAWAKKGWHVIGFARGRP